MSEKAILINKNEKYLIISHTLSNEDFTETSSVFCCSAPQSTIRNLYCFVCYSKLKRVSDPPDDLLTVNDT